MALGPDKKEKPGKMFGKNHIAAALFLMILMHCASPAAFGQEQQIATDHEQFAEQLQALEGIILSGDEIDVQNIEAAEQLLVELENSSYNDLVLRGRVVVFMTHQRSSQLTQKRLEEISAMLEAEEHAQQRDVRLKRASRITFGTAAVSLVLFNVFWIMADRSYEQYQNATTPEDAREYQQKSQNSETLSYIFAAAGVISLGVSIPLFAARSPQKEIKDLED
jgi:hypothetical protein